MDDSRAKDANEFSVALDTLGLRIKDFAAEVEMSRDHVGRMKSGKSRITKLVKGYVELRLEVRRLLVHVDELNDRIKHPDERDAAAIKTDAARYRWLRDNLGEMPHELETAADLDEFVNREMKS